MKITMANRFTSITIVIMSIIFIINLIISRNFNLLWIVLSGGGYIVDYLGHHPQQFLKSSKCIDLLHVDILKRQYGTC